VGAADLAREHIKGGDRSKAKHHVSVSHMGLFELGDGHHEYGFRANIFGE
jgi:hypothetical protein